jgi:hypothetical protein
MDPNQPVTNWPRLVRSAVGWLRNDLAVASGYGRIVERVGPVTEQQAKCLDEIRRSLKRIRDRTDRLDMLVRWSQQPLRPTKVHVVELGPLINEVVAGLSAQELDPPWQVRTEVPWPTVLANRDDLKLLIEKVSLCVRHALRSGAPTIWLREPSVSSPAEHWVVIAGADHLEAAANADNLVPFTDDRASSIYLLDIAVASRQVEANGGRVLCFREKVPGAVIALPRD